MVDHSGTPGARPGRWPFERAVPATLVAVAVYAGMVWLTTQLHSIRAVSQWQDDPADAIATFGVQVAFVVAAITLVRWLRSRKGSPIPARAVRYLSRGCWTLLAVAWTSVVADWVAQVSHAAGRFHGTLAAVPPAALLVASPALLAATAVVVGAQLARGRYGFSEAPGAQPDDALADIAVLARRAIGWTRTRWPALATAAEAVWALGEDIGRRVPSLNLRRHPWRCCLALAVLAGGAVALGHAMAEGPGPGDGLLRMVAVAALFVAVEGAAVLVAFALLRGWLGLVIRAA